MRNINAVPACRRRKVLETIAKRHKGKILTGYDILILFGYSPNTSVRDTMLCRYDIITPVNDKYGMFTGRWRVR